MTPFHPQQSDRGRCCRRNANGNTLKIRTTNSTTKLHAHVHEAQKIQRNHVQSTVQAHIIELSFYAEQALPLSFVRFFRLAKISPKITRSPARRSRDGRETSGEKSGKMSRVIFVQRPSNGRAVAAAMSLNVRQDDSQDNWPCAGISRAMSAPKTCETTRNTNAQQPCRSLHNGQCNISRVACRILVIGF